MLYKILNYLIIALMLLSNNLGVIVAFAGSHEDEYIEINTKGLNEDYELKYLNKYEGLDEKYSLEIPNEENHDEETHEYVNEYTPLKYEDIYEYETYKYSDYNVDGSEEEVKMLSDEIIIPNEAGAIFQDPETGHWWRVLKPSNEYNQALIITEFIHLPNRRYHSDNGFILFQSSEARLNLVNWFNNTEANAAVGPTLRGMALDYQFQDNDGNPIPRTSADPGVGIERNRENWSAPNDGGVALNANERRGHTRPLLHGTGSPQPFVISTSELNEFFGPTGEYGNTEGNQNDRITRLVNPNTNPSTTLENGGTGSPGAEWVLRSPNTTNTGTSHMRQASVNNLGNKITLWGTSEGVNRGARPALWVQTGPVIEPTPEYNPQDPTPPNTTDLNIPNVAHEVFQDPETGHWWRVLQPATPENGNRALIITEFVHMPNRAFHTIDYFTLFQTSWLNGYMRGWYHNNVGSEMASMALDYEFQDVNGNSIRRTSNAAGAGLEVNRGIATQNGSLVAVRPYMNLERAHTRPIHNGTPEAFILSTSELNEFFGPEGLNGNEPENSQARITQMVNPNTNPSTTLENGGTGANAQWWLRSPGANTANLNIARHSVVAVGGDVIDSNNNAAANRGVRPALWIQNGPSSEQEEIEVQGITIPNVAGAQFQDPETGHWWRVLKPANEYGQALIITEFAHAASRHSNGMGYTPWRRSEARTAMMSWFDNQDANAVVGPSLRAIALDYEFQTEGGNPIHKNSTSCSAGIEHCRPAGSTLSGGNIEVSTNNLRAHSRPLPFGQGTPEPFALSVSEINQYFGPNGVHGNNANNASRATRLAASNTSPGTPIDQGGQGNNVVWGTRSASVTGEGVLNVHQDNRHTAVGVSGDMRGQNGSWSTNFRPALWVQAEITNVTPEPPTVQTGLVIPDRAHANFQDPETGLWWRVLQPADEDGYALIITEHIHLRGDASAMGQGYTPWRIAPSRMRMRSWFDNTGSTAAIGPSLREIALDYEFQTEGGLPIDKESTSCTAGIEVCRNLGSQNSVVVNPRTNSIQAHTRPRPHGVGTPEAFSLSLSEVNHFFGDEGVYGNFGSNMSSRAATAARVATPNIPLDSAGIEDSNIGGFAWITRSPSVSGDNIQTLADSRFAAINRGGFISNHNGTHVNFINGHRPALWVQAGMLEAPDVQEPTEPEDTICKLVVYNESELRYAINDAINCDEMIIEVATNITIQNQINIENNRNVIIRSSKDEQFMLISTANMMRHFEIVNGAQLTLKNIQWWGS